MKRKFFIALLSAPLLAWGLYQLTSGLLARTAASRFGLRLLRLGDGKFTDPAAFVQARLSDAAILVSAACLLTLAALLADWAVGSIRPRARWVFGALIGFAGINLFAAVAGRTALYWCLLFTGKGATNNYTQFQIKRHLMREASAPLQAVLFGSSQTRAEIDERQLNNVLGKKIWTTELSFPGNRAYDLLLSLEALPPVKVDFVVCYLSETYFYSGADSEGLPLFFGFRDLGEFHALGGAGVETGRGLGYGLLGDALPLFRHRDSIAGRVLGPRLLFLPQEIYGAGLSANLAERAETTARQYKAGPASDFQKRAFSAFARQCSREGCRLVVCAGQLNPVLAGRLPRALRPDMLAFLRSEAARDPNIVLLDEPALPAQTEADYADLTHVNEAAQARFSGFLAAVLEKLAAAPRPAPTTNRR